MDTAPPNTSRSGRYDLRHSSARCAGPAPLAQSAEVVIDDHGDLDRFQISQRADPGTDVCADPFTEAAQVQPVVGSQGDLDGSAAAGHACSDLRVTHLCGIAVRRVVPVADAA